MFYTVTLNPSIDYTVTLSELVCGITNRTRSENFSVGGKGINVSLVLAELGIESTALGFAAGFTGEELLRQIASPLVHKDFIMLRSGSTRINVKIKAGSETEINGAGAVPCEEELDCLLNRLDILKDGDTLVLAGSVPSALNEDTYERFLERVSGRNVRTVVDACGKLLLRTLSYRPFLIKPNRQELEEIFGVTFSSQNEIPCYAGKLQKMGARNVIVSLGGDGAYLLDENGRLHFRCAMKGTAVSTVGAGDSMTAGFIAGYEREGDYAAAFALGTACGAATAFSEGLARCDEIDSLYQSLCSYEQEVLA